MQMGVRNQYLKELIIFDRIYKNDNKFGDIGDKFNFKVTIFLNKYKKVGLPENAYI